MRLISGDPVLNEAGSALIKKHSVRPASDSEDLVVVVVAVVVSDFARATFVVVIVFVIKASTDVVALLSIGTLARYTALGSVCSSQLSK